MGVDGGGASEGPAAGRSFRDTVGGAGRFQRRHLGCLKGSERGPRTKGRKGQDSPHRPLTSDQRHWRSFSSSKRLFCSATVLQDANETNVPIDY